MDPLRPATAWLIAAATSAALMPLVVVPVCTGTFCVGTPTDGSPWPRPAPPPPPALPPPPARFAWGLSALSSGDVSGVPPVPWRVTSTTAPTTAATADAASSGDLWNSAPTDSTKLTSGRVLRAPAQPTGQLERAG